LKVRLSPKDLQRALNDDSEFRIASRFWDGSLQFEFGAEVCRLELRGGEVASIDATASTPGRGDVVVKAPIEDWAKLLEEVPPPFYQEFYSVEKD
jgi:putative sterol carrier protein